nr:hypothetical protein [uncultured Capnocytophaga sp.]
MLLPPSWRESHTRLQVFSHFSSCLLSQELVALLQIYTLARTSGENKQHFSPWT